MCSSNSGRSASFLVYSGNPDPWHLAVAFSNSAQEFSFALEPAGSEPL